MSQQIYNVYLNNSNNDTSEFINSVEASSASEAIDKTKTRLKIKIKIGQNSPYSLTARLLGADINAALGGSSSQTIDTNININQSGGPGETNSCALNAILANISSAISKKEELKDCTIDINKLILCLSENLEKQKLPSTFNRDLQNTNNFIYPDMTDLSAEDRIKADRASKFLKLYLGFKYNLFPTIRVPLKPKDTNDNSQTVLDFDVSNLGAQQNKLNNLKKAIKAREKKLLENRNKNKGELPTFREDPVWKNLAAQIKNLEDEIKNSTQCIYDNCSVSVNIRPKFIDRIKNSSNNKINRFTTTLSYIFVEIAKIIRSGNSVSLFIRPDANYINTLNGPDVNTITIDNFTGSNNGNLHIVSIIGISTENSDGGITLTIQDSYNTSGSNNRNIFKIKLPKSYFKSEIENLRPESQYNLGFQNGLLSNQNQVFVGVDVDVIPQDEYCCENSLPCPQYPVTVYITGGVVTSGSYRSLEIQCLDANNVRVYETRQSNNGNFVLPYTYSNGLPILDPDPESVNTAKFQGCLAVAVHQFLTANDAPFEVFPVGQTDGFSITISPDEFECCVPYEPLNGWCDNPQGTCEDDPS